MALSPADPVSQPSPVNLSWLARPGSPAVAPAPTIPTWPGTTAPAPSNTTGQPWNPKELLNPPAPQLVPGQPRVVGGQENTDTPPTSPRTPQLLDPNPEATTYKPVLDPNPEATTYKAPPQDPVDRGDRSPPREPRLPDGPVETPRPEPGMRSPAPVPRLPDGPVERPRPEPGMRPGAPERAPGETPGAVTNRPAEDDTPTQRIPIEDIPFDERPTPAHGTPLPDWAQQGPRARAEDDPPPENWMQRPWDAEEKARTSPAYRAKLDQVRADLATLQGRR